MLLRASAEHLRVGRCEAQVPLKQANYHPGGFTGWGEPHSRRKGSATCWFVLSTFLCVSVCPSFCVCPTSVYLSFPMFFVAVSICLCVLLFVSVCLSIFLGMPVSLCVSACATVCVMYVGQFCVCCSGDSDMSRWGKVSQPSPEMGQASRVGGAQASPAAGSSAGPPRHPPGRGPWCLRGEGPCTGPPHRACPPAGGGRGP